MYDRGKPAKNKPLNRDDIKTMCGASKELLQDRFEFLDRCKYKQHKSEGSGLPAKRIGEQPRDRDSTSNGKR